MRGISSYHEDVLNENSNLRLTPFFLFKTEFILKTGQ